jgi:aspartate dehydrogenase
MIKVGLLGFGAIGSAVAEAIGQGKAGATELVAVLVRDPSKVKQAAPAYRPFTASLPEFLNSEIDIVVEAAGHQALRQYAEPVLKAGKHLMPVSVGAFADYQFFKHVRELATNHGCRVLIPSGAVAGLDAISAACLAEIEEVSHTTRKNPRAFTLAQLGGIEPREPTVLYDGPAQAGVKLFPDNVNVAAAVALAGVGMERTRLCVIADPTVVRNTHDVQVRGYFGTLRVVIENIPTGNPKTGRIVSLSIVKTLQKLSEPVVIGT